ncbi:MAG TPA: hypothetical protein VHR66_14860 [Gemmataceae bacterium]|nr:hypothetical protein [Gemmataceae bacterium]
MRGRGLLYAAIGAAILILLLRSAPAPKPLHPLREPEPTTELGGSFDAGQCGQVHATIAWGGPLPLVKPIDVIRIAVPLDGQTQMPNPNAPRIQNDRVAGVFVYLARVDLRKSHEWTLPSPTIEVRTKELVINQAGVSGRVGIARRGQAVDLVSRDAAFQSIRGRGANFFTQMLTTPDQPVRRVLSDAGVVELSSASGYYWLRGYLLVLDHPYAAVTTPDGTIDLEQVPEGDYELTCWMPNWRVERIENDPEWAAPVRLYYEAPVVKRRPISVKAGQRVNVTFPFATKDFGQRD